MEAFSNTWNECEVGFKPDYFERKILELVAPKNDSYFHTLFTLLLGNDLFFDM